MVEKGDRVLQLLAHTYSTALSVSTVNFGLLLDFSSICTPDKNTTGITTLGYKKDIADENTAPYSLRGSRFMNEMDSNLARTTAKRQRGNHKE